MREKDEMEHVIRKEVVDEEIIWPPHIQGSCWILIMNLLRLGLSFGAYKAIYANQRKFEFLNVVVSPRTNHGQILSNQLQSV